MSDVPEPTFQPQPAPTPKSNSNRTILIVVIAVIVVLCCLCALVGAAGAALVTIRSRSNGPAPFENGQPFLGQPTPEEGPILPTEEPSATPESIQIPEPPNPSDVATQAAGTAPGGSGLGFSQDELVQFFQDSGGFKFGDPFTVQGQNAVMGTHPSICVQSDCAAVTLLGPADDIEAVSVVVPIDPNDRLQSLTAITVLMNSVVKFASEGAFPAQMMSDLIQAQSGGSDFTKTVTDHGYKLTYNYDPKVHHAGLAVSRKK